MEFHLSFLNERQISGWGRGDPEGADQTARSQKSAVSGQTITSGLAQSSDMIGVDRRVSTVPDPEVGQVARERLGVHFGGDSADGQIDDAVSRMLMS